MMSEGNSASLPPTSGSPSCSQQSSLPSSGASACSSQETPQNTPHKVKMYTRIPIQASPNEAKKAKVEKCKEVEHKLKADIDSFQETLSSRFMEFDTHIKAALYSVLKKNPPEAAETLEKIRKIMKACTKKTKSS